MDAVHVLVYRVNIVLSDKTYSDNIPPAWRYLEDQKLTGWCNSINKSTHGNTESWRSSIAVLAFSNVSQMHRRFFV